MTKTLTEQWRDGTLGDGYYYIISKKWGILIDRFKDQINDCGNEWRGFDNCQGIVYEVLAPVPSYDECKDLYDSNKQLMTHIKTCEQQIEKLQEQLKEANEILMMPDNIKYHDEVVEMLNNYMEKWGVK